MSNIFNKNAEQIRRAKYRVKNAQGQYEIVYLETSADQVEQTSDRVFVTPAEKSQITSNKEAIAAETQARETAVNGLSGRLDVIEGTGEGSVKKALQDAKAYTDTKISEVNGANAALEVRVAANEGALALVDGKIDTAKNEAINTAKSHTNSEIAKIDAAFKEADTAIKGRLDSLESATSDLGEIRTNISSNASAISKEVSDRKTAVESVERKLNEEVSRATGAESQLTERINAVSGEVTRVEELVSTKATETLNSAKRYTDEKVSEINDNAEALEERVTANETALGLVDGKISTAKTEAIDAAKAHTNSEISKIDAAYKAADVKVLSDAKSYADTKIGEAKTALERTISAVDAKVDTLQGNVTTLEGRVSVNESDIQNLKDAVSNKNNNTIVVNNEDEIAVENPNPKVGDLAYVISSKRAYIFKGVNAISAKSVPQGWVVFDEITSELDLVDYLKKTDAEATYRKLSVKIAESDLATELVNKIDAKADKSYVDGELAKKTNEAYVNSKVEEVVAPVRTESAQNKANIAKEVQDRTAEITRVEGVITSSVNAAKQELTSSLTEKEKALKAEDAKLNNKISKFATVVSAVEPVDTEAGHVWLELV